MANNVAHGLLAGLLTISVAVPLLAQQPEQARFDVVSIKRNLSGAEASSLRPDANGLTGTNVNLIRLLRTAYLVSNFQIVDAPGWFQSERYDIQARATGTVTLDQLRSMIQDLLAGRFGLRVIAEKRPVNGFELRVERPGAVKVRTASQPCTVARGDQPRAAPGAPACFRALEGDVTARGVPMSMVAFQLQGYVGQPVEDRTGLDAVYDFELKWAPDSAGAASNNDDPSLFTAVREQLGLRLVPGKPVVDVLIIDGAHRPSEN